MSIYLKIPILANNPVYSPEDFQARYLELTTARGDPENFVLNNMREEAGVNQMSGSTKLHIDDAATLKSEFPMIQYYVGFPSSGQWTPKIESE